MMKLFQKYKNTITIIVIIGAGFFVYTTFFKSENSGGALVAENVNPTQTAVEQELLSLLLELRSIQLDISLFGDPEFQSLSDFSQELVPEPVGRPNPFVPLR
jgi:hypothetical protein